MKPLLMLAAALLLGTDMSDPVHPSLRQNKPHDLKTTKRSDKALELGRKFARISRAPLKRQNSSDAWNERANKLTAGRVAADLMLKSAKLRGQNQ